MRRLILGSIAASVRSGVRRWC